MRDGIVDGGYVTFMTGIPGGISQADVNKPEAIDAIKQAIAKHNTDASENLEFVKILELTQQVVAGMRYRAKVECTKDGAAKQYDVDVWVKVAGQGIEIQKFEAL